MRIDRYISRSRVIDLKSTDFKNALVELLEVCDFSNEAKIKRSSLLKKLLEGERQMTTYLGGGISLPHARVSMKRSYLLAVGRCPEGLEYEGQKEYGEIRYVFLLLASDRARNYLYSLASLARVFQDKAVMD